MRYERRTSRLEVRPYRLEDYAAWRTANSTMLPPQNEWDNGNRPARELTRAHFRKLVADHVKRRKDDYFYTFGVFRKKDGAMVGKVSLMEISRGVHQGAILGYSIFNRYWGQGYAKESIRAVIEIAFDDLLLHRIEAGIEPRNRRSILLARTLKMRPEGKKLRCLYLRKQWVDLLIYSLTCEDLGLPWRGPEPQLRLR